MGEYDYKFDEAGKQPPAPKHHRLNMEGYLRSYLYSPALYLLSVARARQVVEAQCGHKEPQDPRTRKTCGVQRETMGSERTSSTRERPTKERVKKKQNTRLFFFFFFGCCCVIFIIVMLTLVFGHS